MAETPTQVPVLLPIPQDRCYSYRIEGQAPEPGTIVRIPFRNSMQFGVVWDDEPGMLPPGRLKPVTGIIDLAPFGAVQRRFIDRVASWTFTPRGAVLRMALPQSIIARRPVHERVLVPGGRAPLRMTPARAHVLAMLDGAGPMTAAVLARHAGVSASVVSGLLREGVLAITEVISAAPFAAPDPDAEGPVLSADQRAAADHIIADIDAGVFQPSLLHGVTGSGKTEVYFEAIAEVLRHAGMQCLVLLPEIALTSQWLERFAKRFGTLPAQWHSDLGGSERHRVWHGVASGEVRIVVGARSALFLPFHRLGLIVVDEEHDPSFKQEEGVLYQARDMAVLRASIGAIPVLLASATPAIETLVNAERGRYRHLRLENRHGGAALPVIEAVDMRLTPPASGDWIAPPLAQAISETLGRGEQSLLFLNRRGYAPLTLCRACGARLECPNCTAWLVEHRLGRQLACHHCGHSMPTPERCPACGESGCLMPCGPGVERIAEEVMRRWPLARMASAASDSIRTPADMRALIARMEAGAIDILIGTQIVTKGYHFPGLTLVGVIDADLGLKGGDLRAGERSAQQLVQVAGRAGRGERPGRAIIQTYDPDHPATAALIAGDLDAFIKVEIAGRAAASMPPFGRLAALVISSPSEAAAVEAGRRLAAAAPSHRDISVFGPAPAPLARLRGRYRFRMLVHGVTLLPLQPFIRDWLQAVSLPTTVRLRVDIDPASFL